MLATTIHDVAKKAGVGIGTVSSVINNSRPVSPATRQRVLAAIDELDFMPNPSGRRLSMGKTHTIGVVVPYFTSPSQIERLRGVMSVIVDSDYDISVFSVETLEQRNKVFQTVPRQGRIDGLLIFSIDPSDHDLERIERRNIPTVLVEAYHSQLASIWLDDQTAARTAVEHLLDLGHKKIAYIGEFLDEQFGPFSQNRYQGYCQALEAAGITPNADYFRQCHPNRECGREMALDLLKLPNAPTAIFAYSDVQALGVLETARDFGLSVPGDLSVLGYDDIETAHFAQLTTTRQRLFESGVQGVNLLIEIIQNPTAAPVHTQLDTELIIRRTTGPPKVP